MKISNEQAEYLLKLPKKIVGPEGLLESLMIDQQFPFNQRFEMISAKDDEFTFLLEIKQSQKKSIRVSFHHQENDTKTGLLRVDYNSGHQNPAEISALVPEKFHPFVGKTFSNREHHIHYHVQGYKSLAWAIPLVDDDFQIKELNVGSQFNNALADIIKLFTKTINLETVMTINPLLL